MFRLFLCSLCYLVLSGCSAVYENGNFGGFKRSLNYTSHGYSVVKDPTGNAPTEYIQRFELRDGECATELGWSDCRNNRERTELSQVGENFGKGWYGWYIYVPETYENIYPVKVALGQFHQRSLTTPAIMFQNFYGGLHVDVQRTGNTIDHQEIIDKDDFKGRWHKIELNVSWSEDGFIKVYVNRKLKYSFEGDNRTSSGTYFKYGIYRTHVSRYLGEIPTQIVYYTGLRKGKTREDLEVN
ncbi:heparin lyase I family protein [Halomonas aquatica]|uniref:Heparin lyase I family protein n=1 Tax=Halomonas aquatica TaxID=3151123 RepID=A0ABV1NGH5_9GAMM